MKPRKFRKPKSISSSTNKKKKKNKGSFTESQLRALFEDCLDVQFETHSFGEEEHKVFFILCDGMVDDDLYNQLISKRMADFFAITKQEPYDKETILEKLYVPSLTEMTTEQEVVSHVFSGKVLILFESLQLLFSADLANRPQRNPEQTTSEVTIKGPRDDFIEDLTINIALIRKRVRTNSLQMRRFEIGRRSLTEVALLFMDDLADIHVIEQITDSLKKVDIDSIFSGTQLMELIDKKGGLFPRHDYTGRPDYAIEALMRGRVVLLIDGVAYAVITPVNLFMLFKTSEDIEYNPYFSTFERFIRIGGVVFSAILPALWVALTTFHQNQIPLILLATVVESRRGLPLPSALEAFFMLLIFELLREAGMRLPIAIGGTLSVIGGLIIGDAAIRAGLTSPAMLVVIALSTIGTFTLLNQSLIGSISLLRILSVVFVSFLGLFGFFLFIYAAWTYLARIKVFGVPYLALASDLSLTNILQSITRLRTNLVKKRPAMLKPKDPTRQGEDQQ